MSASVEVAPKAVPWARPSIEPPATRASPPLTLRERKCARVSDIGASCIEIVARTSHGRFGRFEPQLRDVDSTEMPKTLTGQELQLDDGPARDSELFLVDGNNLAYRAF